MRAALEYLPGDLFGLEELERRALAADPTLEGFPGLLVPRRLESIPVPLDRFDAEERALLAQRWEAQLTALEPHVAVLESVRKLASPGCSVVLVEAPPHFCGSPLGVIYRALHAIRLARGLTEAWGRPVVPVLFNDSDGHELEPVRNLELLNDNLHLRRVSPASLGSNRHPISSIPLTEDPHRLAPIRAFLRQELVECPHAEELLEIAFPRLGETLETAFSRWILTLLGPLGLIVLQPGWVREELSHALADQLLLDPRRELAPNGAESPALLYRVSETGRTALRPGGDGFQYEAEVGSRTPAEMAAVIVQEPAGWSPSELMLPLVQTAVLPVAAHVGTWEQWPRFVRTDAFRVRTGQPPAVFVPALRATLIDPDCAATLRSSPYSLAQVFATKPARARASKESSPIAARMREMTGRATRELRALRAELAEFDRGLSIQLKRTAGSVEGLVENLATRIDRAYRNHGGHQDRKLRRLRNGLVPRDQPQEAVLGALPILARYGFDWLSELLEQLDELPTEHLAIELVNSESSA